MPLHPNVIKHFEKGDKPKWNHIPSKPMRIPAQFESGIREIAIAIDKNPEIEAELLAVAKLIEEGLWDFKNKKQKKINPRGETDSNPEWYTPPEYIELARKVLGKITLDPASNEVAQQWIKAETYFTKESDGYHKEWFGRVFLNPPYGRDTEKFYGSKGNIPCAQYWMDKAIAEYKAGRIESAIILVNRTGAKWYKERLASFDARCEVSKRIGFIDKWGEAQKAPPHYNDVFYLGTAQAQFKATFEAIGWVL